MSININLDFILKDLEGNDLNESQQAGKLLATVLTSNKTPGITPIKAYDWAVKLYNSGKIDIDRSDIELLVKVIEGNEILTNLGKAQILIALNKAKDEPNE